MLKKDETNCSRKINMVITTRLEPGTFEREVIKFYRYS